MSAPSIRSNSKGRSVFIFIPKHCLRIVIMCASLFTTLWVASLLTLSSSSWLGLLTKVNGSNPEDVSPPLPALLTREELIELVQVMQGDDTRIMRWNAKSHTRHQQSDGGCNALLPAIELVKHYTSSVVKEQAAASAAKDGEGNEEDTKLRLALACEYITFCVTDNPKQRQIFSEVPGIHPAIVSLVGSDDAYLSAKASHVIYIATFSNTDNHRRFFRSGAVSALSNVILRYGNTNEQEKDMLTDVNYIPVRADQMMWAAAALQNLAASYCNTKHDGRCYWHWEYDEGNPEHSLRIDGKFLPVVSDGTSVRLTALKNTVLIQKLTSLACEVGPVAGGRSAQNPFPGDNAVIGRDENSPNLVAWAVTGALKNLALEPQGRDQMQHILPCLCRMSHSPDWLEENKGVGALLHLRLADPCWFNHRKSGILCIDDNFQDAEGYHCGDYGKATKQECEQADVVMPNWKAKQACCGCGGGNSETAVAPDREL